MPTFAHRFEPAAGAPTIGHIDLTVREIEDAGIREMLQTPGASLGSWKFLDALLDSGAPSFRFLEPLGHAREVKTAVSGLFGRFVARAYATKYLDLTHFVHVRKPPMALSGRIQGELRRVSGLRGDMPDWVAWGPTAGVAIVEAKGCHDPAGPQAALDRGYAQAERAEIAVAGVLAPFKRYAIATRWGFTAPFVTEPMLWVRDPDSDGMLMPAEKETLGRDLARRHAAALLRPLGFEILANALLRLTDRQFKNQREDAQRAARAALGDAPAYRIEAKAGAPDDGLIGGFVSRAGVLADAVLTPEDQATLSRQDLAPSFVGLERQVVKRLIEDEEVKLDTAASPPRRPGEDGAGSWVIRLDRGDAAVIEAST